MGKGSAPSAPDPTVTAAAQGQANDNTARLNARLNRVNQRTPYGTTIWNNNGDTWEMLQDQDPRITEDFFAGLNNNTRKNNLGSWMNDAVKGFLTDENGNYRAFNPQDIPSMTDRVDPNNTIAEYDLRGLNDLPGQDDFGAERSKVEDAMYGRSTSRLDPQWNQRQTALENQLTNQGMMRGSEAWNKAMDDFSRQRNDAYSTARQDAITGGGAEQSRLFANALQARSQGFGERQAAADLYNRAAQQDYDQMFRSGQFMNAARSQRFAEELQKRNQPMDEYARLINGAGPGQQSNMTGTSNLQGSNPVDIAGIQANANQMNMNRYSADVSRANANTGAAASIASALIAAFASDKNIKDRHGKVDDEDTVEKVKRMPVERWNYKGDGTEHTGPMAQDFAEQFGGDGKTIPVIDAVGNLYSAVRGLASKVDRLEGRKGARHG